MTIIDRLRALKEKLGLGRPTTTDMRKIAVPPEQQDAIQIALKRLQQSGCCVILESQSHGIQIEIQAPADLDSHTFVAMTAQLLRAYNNAYRSVGGNGLAFSVQKEDGNVIVRSMSIDKFQPVGPTC